MELNKLITCLVTAGLIFASAGAAELPGDVILKPDGTVKIAGLSFNPLHLGSKYVKSRPDSNPGAIVRAGEILQTQTDFKDGRINVSLTPADQNTFDYNASIEFKKTVETLGLMLDVSLPGSSRIVIPGENTDFGTYNPKKTDLLWTSCKEMSIELTNGKTIIINGNITAKLIDRRGSGKDSFELRFYFSPWKGNIRESRLHLTFCVRSYAQSTIDLKKVVNSGYRDDKAGDGSGGWTDQGPTNDLRGLNAKKIHVGYVVFDIIDQDSNHGNAVIAIGKKRKDREVKIDVNAKGNYLGLIHSTAWTQPGQSGEIQIRFHDGSSQRIDIISGRDVSNWWEPLNLKNGYIAWTGITNNNRVGLYFSQFRLNRNDPSSITLRGNDSQLWLISALSLFEKNVDTSTLMKEYVTVPGNDWIALDAPLDTMKGSPLDFSNQLDAPAGKYGRVIINSNGHFAFEQKKDVAIRFVGTNLCFTAQYLNKSEADALAERLARSGYNAVRIHHHDKYLVDSKASDSLTFDEKNLDRLDYLIYALKKRGIYIATDIYVNRIITEGDNIPEFEKGANGQVKSLLPISPKMRENWKAFAKKWLTHRNPYTGMDLLHDPVLYSINLTNENNLYQWWRRYPGIAARYRVMFLDWQKKNIPGKTPVTLEQNKSLFVQFIYELQEKYTLELYNYLKDTLEVKALLSDLNMHNKIPLALIRDKMDIVDSHKYHDHPKFPGGKPFKYPFSFRQQSAIARLGYDVPGELFAARILGKPFSVTEYRYCPPNRYRVEGGSLIGAYAALQDWDALYQFAWEHSSKAVVKDSPMGSLNSAHDPLTQLSDRLTMFLFRRKDVASAKEGFGLKVSSNFWKHTDPIDCPEKFSQLGLITKVGLVVGDRKIQDIELISRAQAEGAVPLSNENIEKRRQEMFKTGVAKSTSGELLLDSRSIIFKANTPNSAVLTAVSGSHQVGLLQVSGIDSPTTVAACSLDKLPLTDSNKILVFHLTDVSDSGSRYQSKDKRLMLSGGRLPHLLRRSKVEIKLELSENKPVTVYALKNDGGTNGRVEASFSRGKLGFSADNSSFTGGVMAYLIERQTK